MLRQTIAFSVALVIGIVFMSALWVGARAFTEPTAAPPTNNTLAPINVGAAAQTKAGALIVTNVIQAKRFVNAQDNTTYVGFATGSKFKGKIDLGGHAVVNAAKPVNATDVANKAYVDAGAVAP